MAIKISGSTIIDDARNIVNAGVLTATDAVITGNLTVQGTTTTIDTTLLDVDRIEVGANSNTLPAIAVTQSGSANIAEFYNSGGNSALTLTTSNRLGVGTAEPKSNLEVLGSFAISDGAGYGVSIRSYNDSYDPDVISLVPGSSFGTLFESREFGHLVFGLRDNDVGDSVSILSGSGNYTTDSTYDKVIARFQADGKVGIGMTFIAGGPGLHVAGIITSSSLQVYGSGAYFGGSVGIGTVSPKNLGHFVRDGQVRGVDRDEATLRVEGGDSYNSEIYLTGDDTHVGQIRFGDATSSYRGAINYYHNGDYLTIVTSGNENVKYSAYNQYHNVGIVTYYSQESVHFTGQYTVVDQLYLDNYRNDIGSSGYGGAAIVFNNQDSNNGGVNEARIKSVTSNSVTYFGSSSEASNHFVFEVSDVATPRDVMAITSLGRVGINSMNPDVSLEIYESTPVIRLKDSDSESYSDIDGNGGNLILRADRSDTSASSYIEMNIDAQEKAKFTSDGYLRFASGTSGIQFNGDTDSDDALDAYEEGTWSPDLRSSATSIKTYTDDGYYVRIGSLVHCGLQILDNSFSTALTGEIRIYGLPFTPTTNSKVNTMSPITYNGAFNSADYIGQINMSSSTYINVYTDPGADSGGILSVNSIPTAYRIYAQFTYTIA